MNELIKTKRQSSAVQAARVERILEIATDNELKNREEFYLSRNYRINCSIHWTIRDCLGYYEFFPINSNIKKYKSGNRCTRYSRGKFATALGLLAAIPAVVAYNKFNSDSKRYISRIENFSKRFLST